MSIKIQETTAPNLKHLIAVAPALLSFNSKIEQDIIKVNKRSSFSDAFLSSLTSGYSGKEFTVQRYKGKQQKNLSDLWHMTMNAICNDMSTHPDVVISAKKLVDARRYFQNVCLTEQHLEQTTKNLDDAMDVAVQSAVAPDSLSSNNSPNRAVGDFDKSYRDIVDALRKLDHNEHSSPALQYVTFHTWLARMDEVYTLADRASFQTAIINPLMQSQNQGSLDWMRIYPWAMGDVGVTLKAKKVFAANALENSYREFSQAASDCVEGILPAGSERQVFKDIVTSVNLIALKKIKQRQWGEDANDLHNPIQMIEDTFVPPNERLKSVKAPNLELSALRR